MAIVFDANLAETFNPASDTVSFTTSGTNRYLVVGILIQSSQTCTGVTYGGVAMTNLTSGSSSNVSTGETIYLWGLANPASGANNIVGSFSGAGTRVFIASSFTGAQQTTAVEATATPVNSTGTSASLSVTTITDNDWLVGFARASTNTTAGSNTTIRGAQSNINMMDSNAVQTPPGTFSLNFSDGSGVAGLAFSLKPAVVVTSTATHFLNLMGVGL